MDVRTALEKRYLSATVAKAVGVESGRLARWVDQGLVRPAEGGAKGSGTRNEYSVQDIVRIRLMMALQREKRSWRDAALLAFEPEAAGIYGQTLAEAISNCIERWTRYFGARSILDQKPEPVFFAYYHDDADRLACVCADNADKFELLYGKLEDVEAPALVNLTAIVGTVLSQLGRG